MAANEKSPLTKRVEPTPYSRGSGAPGHRSWPTDQTHLLTLRGLSMTLPAHHPFRSEKAKQRYLERYALRAAAWPLPQGATHESKGASGYS